MPHSPDEHRYQHLPLVKESPAPDRRKKTPIIPLPHKGGRIMFGEALAESIGRVQSENSARPALPAGIESHLVFRVPIEGTLPSAQLVKSLVDVGITVVAVEPDGAIIAFKDEDDLTAFKNALVAYVRGPRINSRTGELNKTTKWDVFQWIDAPGMRIWQISDRIGDRLSEKIGKDASRISAADEYVLDIELWHPGQIQKARKGVEELQSLLSSEIGNVMTDSFVGQLLCLARVKVKGEMLRKILNLDAIAEVNFPPKPTFDSFAANQVPAKNFNDPPRPNPDGPRVCIVDSGITSAHPLLSNNLGHAEAILTSASTAADFHGHGTMVGGIAVFGDVRACYSSGRFASEITLFSARVLNDQNEFDDKELIYTQMRRAVEFFNSDPYQCRVFNISLGTNTALFRNNNRRQGLWAEMLDTLAREYQVLFVVSAGNHNLAEAANAADAERVLTSYPKFLLTEEDCGLCDPATAAIAITVGGIAPSDIPELRHGTSQQDIVRPVSIAGEPSPCTRVGPGINDSIKPEFVAPAGNFAFVGTGSQHRSISSNDNGINVMSFSNNPTDRLFAYDVGTSFAAPVVAGIASKIWSKLESQFATEVHPNLVRALLGISATYDNISTRRLELLGNDLEGVFRACGYGMIDEDFANDSSGRHVTLLAQDRIKVDTFHIYEVPIPAELHNGSQQKKIVVSLAYDPPVRSRRAQYLGIKMDYVLIRNKSLSDIIRAYSTAEAGSDAAPSAIQGSCKCDLQPGVQKLASSTLKRSEFKWLRSAARLGESYYLVVRCFRQWAPIEIEEQDYAIAVSLVGSDNSVYEKVQQRVQARVQQQTRIRQ